MKKLICALALLVATPALAKTVAITGVAQDQSGSLTPKSQTIAMPAGETGEIDITVTHPDGTPYNLTGTNATLSVKDNSGNIKISRQATIVNAAAGTASFPIGTADTLNLLGTYTYDVDLTASDLVSFYRPVPASSFVVTAGIGQPGQPVTVPASQQPLAQGPAGPTGPQGAAGLPNTIYVAGVAQASEPGLNFSTGVTCSNNPGASRIDCSVSGGGSGSVTSVAMSMPAEFSVSGSPVTTSGTLAASWATESANTVMCGPTSGVAATPGFRALVAADIPALPESQITNLVSDLAAKGTVSSVALTAPNILSVSGSPVTGSGTLALSLATEAKNLIFAGPSSGANAAPTFRALADADMPADAATCTPTTSGDYCSWSGTAWQRTAAPSGASTGNWSFSADTASDTNPMTIQSQATPGSTAGFSVDANASWNGHVFISLGANGSRYIGLEPDSSSAFMYLGYPGTPTADYFFWSSSGLAWHSTASIFYPAVSSEWAGSSAHPWGGFFGSFHGTPNTTVASASTIAPTSGLFHITGTTGVNTITPPTPSSGGTFTGAVDFITDGVVTFGTSGNIATGFTSVASTPYHGVYDGTKWYIK